MAVWTGRLLGVCAGTIVVCMTCLLPGCGGGSAGDADPALPGPERGTARVLSLNEAIAEVDSLAVPEGVDSASFQQLQDELVRVLRERGVERFSSAAPQSQKSAVNDLMINHNPDSSADLTWTYRNQGDGDLNSEVNIADLTPIGIHLGKTGQSPDWNRARNTDNDDNSEVNISDITPIGSNFLNKVGGYWIQRAANPDSSWNLVSQVAFTESSINPDTARRDFSFHLNVPADGQWYRVAPFDGGEIGVPSNAVQAASFVLPGKPGNPAATQGTLFESVELSWDPVVDVEFYEIQRRVGTLGSFEPLADTPDSGTGYTDNDVTTGQRYTYIVRGWQGDKKTDFSIQFEGWPLEIPLTPQNLAASDGTSPVQVSVSWEAVVGAEEYVLYYSLDELGPFAELTRTGALNYDDAAATAEVLNWYYVTAANQAGESPQSAVDSGYLEGAVPIIDNVSPLSGLTGDDLTMLALTSGAAVAEWAWDFGGGATPGTSTDQSPMITLGDPGVYDCSLMVTGGIGSDSIDFQLTVTSDEWVHTIGGALADSAENVGADSDGNVYVIGRTAYPMVAKFSPGGNLIWAKEYETTRDFQWISGSVTPTGNVFVATGLADPGQDPVSPDGEGILNFMLDKDGELVFSRLFEDGDNFLYCRHPRADTDASGNCYVAFSMYSLIDINFPFLVIYKLLPNGQLDWKGFYETDYLTAHALKQAEGMAVDNSGNVYVNGNEAGVLKINSGGTIGWFKGWGDVDGTPHEHGYCVAVDGDGNVLFGGGANSIGDYQPFLVKMQPDGTVLWQKGFDVEVGTTSGHITHLEVDSSGNIYALNPHRSDAGISSRLFHVDPDGVSLGTWNYSTTGNTKIFGLTADNGRIHLTGQAPDNTGSWSIVTETQDNFDLTTIDRTATIAPAGGLLAPEPGGSLVEFSGTLDTGGGDSDVLVMNLRIDNLP